MQRLEGLRAAAKAAYEEADRVEAELIAALPVNSPAVLSDGRRVEVVDNFLDKHGQPRNVAFRPCGVRRFEVKVK